MNSQTKKDLKKIALAVGVIALGFGFISNYEKHRREARDLESEIEDLEPVDVSINGYFNAHPVSISIDPAFSDLYTNKMIKALEELDKEALGIDFVILKEGEQPYENHITIHLDKNVEHTGLQDDGSFWLGCASERTGLIVDEEDEYIMGYKIAGDIYLHPDLWLMIDVNFNNVFMHEFLHILDFKHVNDKDDIMYPSHQFFVGIDEDNVDAINEKYPDDEMEP